MLMCMRRKAKKTTLDSIREGIKILGKGETYDYQRALEDVLRLLDVAEEVERHADRRNCI